MFSNSVRQFNFYVVLLLILILKPQLFVFKFALRYVNDIPLTQTQYFYKKHQSASVSIPHHHHRSRINVAPDENETESYITKVDTTQLGQRKHQKRFQDDEENHHLKPFFRTGKMISD